MTRFILTLLLTLLATTPAPSSETLTNTDVVALVKAGLSPATIIAKISTSPTAFTTDTDALVALAKSKVPDDVIQAMLHASTTSPATPPTPLASTAVTPTVPPESAWTPTAAKPFSEEVWFSSSGRGGVYVLQEYPDDRGTVWCDGSLYLDEKELRANPSGNNCPGVEPFRLPWSRVTAFCYHFDEIIPASDYGRRWPGILRIETKEAHYLVGLISRKQFDDVRSVLHEYRGNIPEHCPDGPGVEVVAGSATRFPITHQWIQYKPDKMHACQGPLTLNEQGLRFVQTSGSCLEQPAVTWDRISRYCFEDGIWTGVQITFFGTKGEEWNFKAVYKENEISLRSLHEQLKMAKPTLTEKCD